MENRSCFIRWCLVTATIVSSLMIMATISLPAVGEENGSPASMSLAERQRWALTMLKRLDQANKVILDPEYVAKQREHFEELATPFVIGTLKEDAYKTVKTLRDEVEKSERIAVEHLDLQLRQTLAQRLTSQDGLKLRFRWLKAWEQTVQTWQKSDDPTARLWQVLQWLQTSCKTVAAKDYAKITPVPTFQDTEEQAKSTEPGVKKPDIPMLMPNHTHPPNSSDDWSLTTSDVAKAEREAAKEKSKQEHKTSKRERKTSKREGEAPAEPKQPAPKPEPKPALNINLDELSAKIGGNNLSLRRLEADLVANKTWDAKRIGPFVTKLKKLAILAQDSQLFYRLLTPTQQKQVKKIGSPASAVKLLRSKIRTARVAILEKQGSATNMTNEQRAELQELDRLSNELDSIDGGKGK